jgi:hypothetical protein
MKATWKDYGDESDLVLVFGHVDAKVIDLGPSAGDHIYGIITHPYTAEEFIGTLDGAKARAEAILRGILSAATAALG